MHTDQFASRASSLDKVANLGPREFKLRAVFWNLLAVLFPSADSGPGPALEEPRQKIFAKSPGSGRAHRYADEVVPRRRASCGPDFGPPSESTSRVLQFHTNRRSAALRVLVARKGAGARRNTHSQPHAIRARGQRPMGVATTVHDPARLAVATTTCCRPTSPSSPATGDKVPREEDVIPWLGGGGV
ncbi:hypothetical protein THAOC_06786 [Thalassiosira oceanica]|uniref:Uncharacterized protein n=1 Tax=Thalassiosira oceanica TaxID=159749 RepID=K0TLC7_THAOC|nr:hypothetical protein THAOC_06786 [Thalassiosira oceanica]|eukprot:EJK71747.1 hypothetical protein THAOC_06786 [Thalassiosira oceanica]